MFSISLVTVDYYMQQPTPGLDIEYSEFRGFPIRELPVIRIFGSTKTGQKACLHIHGVFPYIYIPYDGSEPERAIYKIVSSIDRAINVALGNVHSTAQHVYSMHLVSGIPFYGYHPKESQFFKIFFYNPSIIKKAVELLQSGAILNKIFQPHESHIPFILQFMIDYKLHGMSYMSVSEVKFRRGSALEGLLTEQLLPENVQKMSVSKIEGDANASNISSLNTTGGYHSVNPGLNTIWEEEKQRRRDENKSSQFTPQLSQERFGVISTSSELFYKQKLEEKLAKFQLSLEESTSQKQSDTRYPVYPAETPHGCNILQASCVINHSDPSLNSETGNESVCNRKECSNANFENNSVYAMQPVTDEAANSPLDTNGLSSEDDDLAQVLDNLAADKKIDDDSILGLEEENYADQELLSQSMLEKIYTGDENTEMKVDGDSSLAGTALIENDEVLEEEFFSIEDSKEKNVGENVNPGSISTLLVNKTDYNLNGNISTVKKEPVGLKKVKNDIVDEKVLRVILDKCDTCSLIRSRPPNEVTLAHNKSVKGNIKSLPNHVQLPYNKIDLKPCYVRLERMENEKQACLLNNVSVKDGLDSWNTNMEKPVNGTHLSCDSRKRRSKRKMLPCVDGTIDSSSSDEYVDADDNVGRLSETKVTGSDKPVKPPFLHNSSSDSDSSAGSSMKSCKTSNTAVNEKLTKNNQRKRSYNIISVLSISSTSENVKATATQLKTIGTAEGTTKWKPEISSPGKAGKKTTYRSLSVSVQKSPTKASCSKHLDRSVTSEIQTNHFSKTEFLTQITPVSKCLEDKDLDADGCFKKGSDLTSKQTELGTGHNKSSCTGVSDSKKNANLVNTGCKTDASNSAENNTFLNKKCVVSLPHDDCNTNSSENSESTNTVKNKCENHQVDESINISGIRSFYEFPNTVKNIWGTQEVDENDSFNSSGIRSFYETTFLSDEELLTGDKEDLKTTCVVESLAQGHAGDSPITCHMDENADSESHNFSKCNLVRQNDASENNLLTPVCNAESLTDRSLQVNFVKDHSTPYIVTDSSKNGFLEKKIGGKHFCRKLYNCSDQIPTDKERKQCRRKSLDVEILPVIEEATELEKIATRPVFQNVRNENVCILRRSSCDSNSNDITSSPQSLSQATGNSAQKKTPISFKPELVTSPEEATVSQILKKATRRRLQRRRKSGSPESLHTIQKRNSKSPSLCRILLESRMNTQECSPTQKCEIAPESPKIGGITPGSSFGFEMSFINLQDVRAIPQSVNLTLMTLEAHITTRGDLRPDPAYDPVQAVFYVITYNGTDAPQQQEGIIAVNICDETSRELHNKNDLFKSSAVSCNAHVTNDERTLLEEVVAIVKKWDPDILAGFEIEMLSWGYLIRRAFALGLNLVAEISRIPTAVKESRIINKDTENGVVEFSFEIKIVGRIVLNIWRLLRHEVSVMSYSFENMMYHILHQRIPQNSFRNLTLWWNNRSNLFRWMVVDHYLIRVRGIVRMLDQLDLIGRTCELARLFGIQFYEVLSRGSQFRVESMMMRLAKPYNYVAVSPSVQQRAKMRAPEFLPLIMEPMSRFYTDPVIVLDFQSLYPSMMIAYNYCFSTCLGRVEELGECGPFRFGCTQLKVNPLLVQKIQNNISISPCGVAYVNQNIRRGVLPQMLEEILKTRLMVKKSMKDNKSNKTLQRVLHSRQLGLKLIANVTYGYTSANFSGRMPCIEVGDSVVSKGRETLERAIRLVEETSKWDAKVVYGDTDSLFVLVKGRTRQEAFKIGSEIAEAVTQDNPKPVKLKLEKVYQPCILQTKKRYVGYMYESPSQEHAVYDAKGIETVRRDGCPAVAKILKKCLCILFETHKTSLIKNYLERQFSKMLEDRFNLQDLIFAREYRGISGYKSGACVPALELTRSWLKVDKCAEPRVGERVPYVIVNGPPGLPLIRLVRSPYDVLNDPNLRINVFYYITRVIIPPLDRCFSLLGVDIESWFNSMPRKCSIYLPVRDSNSNKRSTISQYFSTVNCAVCDEATQTGLCSSCQKQPQKSAVILANKLWTWERNHLAVNKICQSCCGYCGPISCMSLDCDVLFRRYRIAKDMSQAPFVRQLQEKLLNF